MENYEKTLVAGDRVCFLLYASSKELVRRYKPYLDGLGLTYTQFITMNILWEKKSLNVKELGKRLYLDSGTLTPLLKKLETKGLISRNRSKKDERCLDIKITNKGAELQRKAADIPNMLSEYVALNEEEETKLNYLLDKLLAAIVQRNTDEEE